MKSPESIRAPTTRKGTLTPLIGSVSRTFYNFLTALTISHLFPYYVATGIGPLNQLSRTSLRFRRRYPFIFPTVLIPTSRTLSTATSSTQSTLTSVMVCRMRKQYVVIHESPECRTLTQRYLSVGVMAVDLPLPYHHGFKGQIGAYLDAGYFKEQPSDAA